MNKHELLERGFEDDLSAAVFKLALIEAYCRGELPAEAVQQIFDATSALKAA